MAVPKVFVSSTCYDLQEERTQLERFIYNHGFQPILSEYSGVYYDVDEHTHIACVNEVANADIFVLIISGRFGGKFKDGTGESITQAEYNKARELGLPVFAFVKDGVNDALHYYKENFRNQGANFANKIIYPCISKQSDAVSIFNFLDSVQRSSTNNGIEKYRSFSDIESHLKKQWAGMLFKYLKSRNETSTVNSIAESIIKLSESTTTLQSLVGSLHDKEIGSDETSRLIHDTKTNVNCLTVFSYLIETVNDLYAQYYPQFETKVEMFLPWVTADSDLEFMDFVSQVEGVKAGYFDDPMIYEVVVDFNDGPCKFVKGSVWAKYEKLYSEYVVEASAKIRESAIRDSFQALT